MKRKEKKFYAIIFLGTIFVVLLMIESTVQAKVEKRKNSVDKGMYEFDSKLGWRLKMVSIDKDIVIFMQPIQLKMARDLPSMYQIKTA